MNATEEKSRMTEHCPKKSRQLRLSYFFKCCVFRYRIPVPVYGSGSYGLDPDLDLYRGLRLRSGSDASSHIYSTTIRKRSLFSRSSLYEVMLFGIKTVEKIGYGIRETWWRRESQRLALHPHCRDGGKNFVAAAPPRPEDVEASPVYEIPEYEENATRRSSVAMDQISIKTPNPKCRLFLKIDQ